MPRDGLDPPAGVTRRSFLRLAAAAGAAGLLAACAQPASAPAPTSAPAAQPTSAPAAAATTAPAAQPTTAPQAGPGIPEKLKGRGEVVFVSWGGTYQDALREAILKPFERDSGIKVIDLSPLDYGKIKAMVDANNVEWDVIDAEAEWAAGQHQALLAKLDYSIIDTEGVPKEFIKDWGVGLESYSDVIAYSTEAFSADNHPRSWAEFWDAQKFPGPRSLYKSPAGTLELAVMADGVPKDQVYPLDVDRAFKSLERIKGEVKVWWTQGAQPAQLLTNKEVVLVAGWANRVNAAIAEGAKAAIEWNQHVIHTSLLSVVKGAPDQENAMKLIAYSLLPERQADFAKRITVGPANQNAFKHLGPEEAKRLPTSPELFKLGIAVNGEWWAENLAKVQERFNAFVL